MKKNKTEYWLLRKHLKEVTEYLLKNNFRIDRDFAFGGFIEIFDNDLSQGDISLASSDPRVNILPPDAINVFGKGINADYRLEVRGDTRLESVIAKFYEREKQAYSQRLPLTLRPF